MSALESQLSYLDQLDEPCHEQVDVLNQLARSLADTDFARSQVLSKRALNLSGQLHYPQGEACALTLLAWLNLIEGRADLALTRALNAEAVARVARDVGLEGHALYMVAVIHDHVGNFNAALQTRYKMIVVAHEANDQSLEGNCLMAIAVQHSRRDEHKKALNYYMQALALYRKINDESERHVLALNNVASALAETGDVLLALQYAKKALAKCNSQNARVHTLILHTFGNIHAAMGQLDESLAYYTHAITLNEQAAQAGYTTDREFEATVQLDMAKVQRAMSQHTLAFVALQRTLEIAQAIDAKPLLAKTHDQLSKAYHEVGNVALALVHAEQREAVRASFRQITLEQHEKVTRVMAILQASRKHVHTEQCQAAQEWLWQSCLHGNAPTC